MVRGQSIGRINFYCSDLRRMGGMNFRDLKLMNEAFLAKKFWRILENPNSVVRKLLKVRYF